MTPAALPTPVAVPADPVRAALADPDTQSDLLAHARAVLGRWLADRPAAERAEAALEAVNEVATRALEKRVEYNPDSGAVPAWLHGFMNNVLHTVARALRRRPVQAPADPDVWDRLASALSPAHEKPAGDRLDAAVILSRLSADQQTVLRLWFVEGLDHAAIADRLGISRENARVRLCRALAAAKTIVGVAPGEDAP
jgi:RNA polymerase sigma factor (sigma-70 family)